MRYDLIPCPICRGKVAIKEYTHPDYKEHRMFYIRCDQCDLSYYNDGGVKKLVRSWNRRFK